MNLRITGALAMLCATTALIVPGHGGLVSHWMLDDAVGTDPVLDSASGYNAAQTGSPVLGVPGKAGTAGSFPSGNNYFRAAGNPAFNQSEFTFSFWFNPLNSGGGYYNVAIANRDGENGFIVYQYNDAIEFWLRHTGGGWQGQSQPIVRGVDQWYHVVGSRDAAGNKKFYVTLESEANATVDQTMTGTTVLLHGSGPRFGIGVRGDGGLPLNGGYLDDVQFYDTALSGAQVQYLFDNPGAVIPFWDGGGTTQNWSDFPNWNPDGDPTGAPVAFDNTAASGTPGAVTNVVDQNFTVQSLTYANSGGNYHTTQVTGGRTLTLQSSSGAPTIDVANQATIGGAIGGTQGLTKTGAGSLTLSGANTYTGGTSIDAGTIVVGNLAALSTGPATVNSGGTLHLGAYNVANDVTLNGGALYIANGASGTITLNNVAGNAFRASGNYRVIAGRITGPGGVTIDGGNSVAGVAFSNPANDFQGNVTINNTFGDYGRLRLDASEVIPNSAILTINGGNLRGHDGTPGYKTETIAGLNGDAGAVVFAPNGRGMILRIGYNDTSSAFAGTLGASWDANWRDISIVKIGAGTLTLSGNSTYTGGTTVDGGTLQVGHVNALGTGAATVNSGGTLDLAGYNVANDITLNGGALFTANGASGTITLNNVPGNTINANGNYRVISGQITGAGGFSVGGINTPGIGLSNPANDFQGDIVVNAGAYLRVDADEVIPDTASLQLDGQLRLEGNGRIETVAGLNGSNRIFAVNGGVGPTLRFGAGGASGSHSGPIGLGGANNKNIALVKIGAGTQTLSGNSDYTGGTTVDGGTLQVGHLNALGVGAVTVNSGATLDVAGYDITNPITLHGGRVAGPPGTLSSQITLGTGGGILQGGAAAYLNFAGQVTGGTPGTTSLTIRDGHVMLSNPGNDFSGNVEVGAGTGYYLATAASEVISDTAIINVSGGSAWKMTSPTPLTETIAGLTNSGTPYGVYAENGSHTLVIGHGDVSSSYGGRLWQYLGTLTLRKIGGGTLTLSGDNAYTGGTVVSQGTIQFNHTNAAGTGTITLGDANTGTDEVRINMPSNTVWPPNVVLNNDIVVSSQAGGRAVIAGVGGTWAAVYQGTITLQNKDVIFRNEIGDRTGIEGRITGTGNVTIECTAGRVNWSNAGNDFVGDVTIDPGATLQVNPGGVIPDTSDVTVNGRMGLYRAAEAIDALNGSGLVNAWPSGLTPVLTVGADDGSGTFSGAIQNGGGTLSLVKTGTGTQTFSGNNTYSGTTNVDAGTLLLDGDHTGGGLYSVAPGATLGGSGSTDSEVIVNGIISPGNNVDTLATGSETWAPGGSYLWEINDTDGTAGVDPGWDLLEITGTLDITATASDPFLIDIVSLAGSSPGNAAGSFDVGDVFMIASTTGGVQGFDPGKFLLATGGISNPFAHTFVITSDGSNVYLNVVPEPATFLLAALGLLGLGAAARRRRKRSAGT